MNIANTEIKLAVLRQRAKTLAELTDLTQDDEVIDTIVVLELGTERVGVSLSAFDEIAPLTPIAVLPGIPKWLAGVAQVRGRLVPVLDLHSWLNLQGSSRARYLAVIRSGILSMAVLVDAVSDVREIRTKDIADTIAFDRSRGHRATTKDFVTLLDVGTLLRHPDMSVNQTGSENAR